LSWAGDIRGAVKVYQDMAAFFPTDELAPEALWQAAQLLEGEGSYSQATRLYEELQTTFPAFEKADTALWRAGWLHFRHGSTRAAVNDWQVLAEGYQKSPYWAKDLFWLGKLGAEPKSEDSDGATAEATAGYWDQLLAADPDDYYALRVQQIRSGSSVSGDRLVSEAVEAPVWDTVQAEQEVLAWLGDWTTVPTGTHLYPLPASLANDRALKRGEALFAAGLRLEAIDAFDGLRSAVSKDPVALAQLAFHFHEMGLAAQASRAAHRVVGLWPDGLVRDAPLAIQRLVYPLAYADLLSAAAIEYGLDPLLLAALVRQESLFEPLAESYAGARGLGQIMPATAREIAGNLAMDDFGENDLYRPSVSIEFAASYFSRQLGYFGNRLLVTLAAYNGGPGNTLRWLEAADDDLDLFVEEITAVQSRIYLQQVYKQYLIYETLYR
jgi:soluble lytic murein transglycosylase